MGISFFQAKRIPAALLAFAKNSWGMGQSTLITGLRSRTSARR
jgi:hypothetical protein